MLVHAAFALWAVLIAACDLRRRQIPNALLLGALVALLIPIGIANHGLFGVSLSSTATGVVLAVLATLPGYWRGMLGAGDVKLAAVMAMAVGGFGIVVVLLVAALVQGLVSVVAWLRGWHLRAQRVPAAPALAAGFCTVLWLLYLGGGAKG